MSKVFISGVTGFQGGAIAQSFLQNNYRVQSLSRRPDANGTADTNLVLGSFAKIADLETALQGVNIAVFVLPLSYDPTEIYTYTDNFLKAAEKCGIERIVWISSIFIPAQKTQTLAFEIKREVREKIRTSDLPYTILLPHVYCDNLVMPWSLPAITQQEILPYPIPKQTPLPWTSLSDLGRFAYAAATQDSALGKEIPLASFICSGETLADKISEKLNKQINFVSVAPDAFEEQVVAGFGETNGREIANIYRYIFKNSNYFNAQDFDSLQSDLQCRPQSIDEWLNEISFEI